MILEVFSNLKDSMVLEYLQRTTALITNPSEVVLASTTSDAQTTSK